ncbi:MAG: glycosyltransferase [Lentisphaerae bacterium]|jgi:rhamnosyltransferase|nr:glycosyltransferase [Lentisphaerota bacterium]
MNNSSPFSVSVVIPALNAGDYLENQLEAFKSQEPDIPIEIIIVDSGSSDKTLEIAGKEPLVKLIEITDFTHGRARNIGVRAAKGDIVALVTQDALPRNNRWLANLLKPLDDPKVAAVYSRQIPRDDAPPTERFFLGHHFPADKKIFRQKEEGQALALTDVFFSNVSAAIRRELLLKYPYDESLIMSEDQQFARDIINAGYTTVYQPESEVTHSHKYSLSSAFRRYFDSVYSLTLIFPKHDMKTSGSIGLKYLWREFFYILRKHPLYLPYYFLYTLAKASGTIAGHFAEKLPLQVARVFSANRRHWK